MNVLVIGLGKVGMTYDLSAPKFQILTHLKAINNAIPKGQNVVYGFDISKSTRKILNENYPAINWAESLMDLTNVFFENVIIATPIEELQNSVQAVLSNISFKNLIIEKPGAANVLEYKQLIELVRNEGKRIMIAFPRRSLPSSLYIKSLLESCRSSSYWKISIQYSGSPKNILSHFIDLIDYWLPDKKFKLYFQGNSSVDEEKSDQLRENVINIKQTSDRYDENTQVLIEGEIEINYQGSGRRIEVNLSKELDRVPIVMETENEINQMIGFGDIALMGIHELLHQHQHIPNENSLLLKLLEFDENIVK